MNKITVFAPNVRHGGGKILLVQILKSLRNENMIAKAYVSFDLKHELSGISDITFNKNNFFSKFISELSMYFSNNKNSKIIFFGNLPPVFKLKSYSYLYLHNSLLIENNLNIKFDLKTYIRLFFERKYLRLFIKNVDEVLVQTPKMYQKVKETNLFPNVKLRAFLDNPASKYIKKNTKVYDFIYPSYGYPYKNHKMLLDAWIHLSKINLFPSLIVTLDRNMHKKLYEKFECAIEEHKLNIKLFSNLDYEDIFKLYSDTRALVWPSLTESFGMPLIEAHNLKLNIIAANVDYISDIFDDAYLFDPNDFVDIANTIKSYMNDVKNNKIKKTKLKLMVFEARDFIKSL